MRHSSTQTKPPVQCAQLQPKVGVKQMTVQSEAVYKVLYFVAVGLCLGRFRAIRALS